MQKLTFFERQIIESGIRVGKTKRAIARSLRRDHKVIQYELNQHTIEGRPYSALTAQRLMIEAERRRHVPKLAQKKYHKLKQYVLNQLQQDYSPEQVAGVLKDQPPKELKGLTISPETIYQYIYRGEGRYEDLYKHLRKGRRQRQRRWGRKARKVIIPSRVSIHDRPEEVGTRLTVGHWESDTVEGKRTTKGNLSVQYERKTMLVRIHKVKNKSAEATEEALRESITSLPQDLWKTITFDNGTEGAHHTKIRDDYNVQTYFCDPYSSWQKGGVENINGLIRQYVPKGSDISKLTDQEIYVIQEKLNNRPRKKLKFLSPNQACAQEVGK